MEGIESPAPEEVRRAKGIRIAGMGLILVFMSGIVNILTLNMLWPFLTLTGFVLVVAGLLIAKKN
jgi:hypothetical protein